MTIERNIMKFLPKELQDSYEYDKKQLSNTSLLSKPLINEDDVLRAHYILADYFTDPTAPD